MFETIWKKTLRREGFSGYSILAAGFQIASFGYGLGAWINRKRPRAKVRVRVPVVSIGNIAVGGTGKTPLVSAIAHEFIARNYRVGIVTRGYGSTGATCVLDRGDQLVERSVGEIGDETAVLARELPEAIFSVHESKSQAASRLDESGVVDVILIDDGFQHFGLSRDIDIVAFDAATPPRWLHPLPLGVLREPISVLKFADVIIMTRTESATNLERVRSTVTRYAPSAEICEASFAPNNLRLETETRPISYLQDKSVFLFAGIGNFEPLKSQVAKMSGTLVEAVELSDHQVYDEITIVRLKHAIERTSPDVVLTTSKDWTKVGNFDFGREFYYLESKITLRPDIGQLVTELEQRFSNPRN